MADTENPAARLLDELAALDQVRRSVQQDNGRGHRGHRGDPPYGIRPVAWFWPLVNETVKLHQSKPNTMKKIRVAC